MSWQCHAVTVDLGYNPAMFSRHCGGLLTVVVLSLPFLTAGQENPSIPIPEIIQRFAANERELVQVRANYVYRQDISVQELDSKNKVAGEYHTVSQIAVDASGKATERILSAPASTLKSIALTPQDFADMRMTQAVALTTGDIEKYDVKYSGKDSVNGIPCYVFEVKPKKIEKEQRYFEGKVWVEDREMHIIKSSGRAVPDIRAANSENIFPRFEMYRERIDGYWLPSSVRADDTLQFSNGPIRIRQITTFDNYRKP